MNEFVASIIGREGWIEAGLADIDAITDYHRRLASQFPPATELRRIPNRAALRLARR